MEGKAWRRSAAAPVSATICWRAPAARARASICWFSWRAFRRSETIWPKSSAAMRVSEPMTREDMWWQANMPQSRPSTTRPMVRVPPTPMLRRYSTWIGEMPRVWASDRSRGAASARAARMGTGS